MGDDLNLALANAALAVTSGWSLMTCSDLKFARFGFVLYLLDGALGVVKYVMPRNNDFVNKAHLWVKKVARPFYLPFIAAEAFVFGSGLDQKFAVCHLIIPGVYFGATELLKKNVNKDILDLNTIVNTISICFSSYKKENIYGGGCALINMVAFMGAKEDSMEFALLVSAANLFAAQFFKDALI